MLNCHHTQSGFAACYAECYYCECHCSDCLYAEKLGVYYNECHYAMKLGLHYNECHYAEKLGVHYNECHYAESLWGAECGMKWRQSLKCFSLYRKYFFPSKNDDGIHSSVSCCEASLFNYIFWFKTKRSKIVLKTL